jgi:hypothetical protein
MRPMPFLAAAVGVLALLAGALRAQVVTPATPTAYQPMELDLVGAEVLSETDDDPNPFLDRRLRVLFTSPTGRAFDVPGFFAGDGTGATATSHTGSVWRARFTPDEAGAWSWSVSFREGPQVAVDLDPAAGTPLDFDGAAGVFDVDPPDPGAPGFLAKGRLVYDGTHYLAFQDGDRFVKGGADSPENWLGYEGFDNTPDALHAFTPHLGDWNPGDPDWDRTDPPGAESGRAIIGALNYLAAQGINSIYFLPMNIGGDAKDTWPYVGPIDRTGNASNDNLHYDISKLAQWRIFFDHAQSLGILLHVVLNEAEAPNKNELDGATLGPERKLFYRELVARFGYLNALQWNISEEYNLSLNLGAATVLEFAAYIAAVDPYEHPTTVHNAGNPNDPAGGPWEPFIAEPDIDLTSLQNARKVDGWGEVVAAYRAETAARGRPIPVMIDEPGSITRDVNSDFDQVRSRMLWDILLGGGGVEWFVNDEDQTLEDFRVYEQVWGETTIAREFVESLPFAEMDPVRGIVSGEASTFGGAEALVKDGEVYAVFLPDASQGGTLDLSGAPGAFTRRWFNPRTGVFEGGAIQLTGGGPVALGAPPADPSLDWVALVDLSGPPDCNDNGVPDDEDIADGRSDDCDGNGVPDECQADSDGDGVIDACEPDCDGDGITDAEILAAPGGLLAAYFSSLDFTGAPLVRIDPVVDFQWGGGGPGGGVSGSGFTSRWTGFLLTNGAGTYEIAATSNDGVRVWIDDLQIIDEWRQQTATEFTASVELPASSLVPVRMEHFQQGGTATAELRWTPPGGAKAIIPEASLRPALDRNGDGIPDACRPCFGDVDGDGDTDVFDFAELADAFGATGLDPFTGGDLDGDGDADALDFAELAADFGCDVPRSGSGRRGVLAR